MEVLASVEEIKKIQNAIVTIGTFDGIHLGHQKILTQLKLIANRCNGKTVLFTFYPHPRMVLFPDDHNLKLLNTQQEKIELLASYGIDYMLVHPFTKDFSRLSSLEFVRDILVNKMQLHTLIIGYNHHFGRNREGDFEQLKQFSVVYKFNLEEIAAVDVKQAEVSSTKIREALLAGNVKSANTFLAYSYSIQGEVIKGKQIGKTLGFPTANIDKIDDYKLIPADGVYVVDVFIESYTDTFKGMLSIGNNPTLNANKKSIEVNILNFNADIYGKQIKISFIERIREQVKFDNLDDLKAQMHKDKETTLKIIT